LPSSQWNIAVKSIQKERPSLCHSNKDIFTSRCTIEGNTDLFEETGFCIGTCMTSYHLLLTKRCLEWRVKNLWVILMALFMSVKHLLVVHFVSDSLIIEQWLIKIQLLAKVLTATFGKLWALNLVQYLLQWKQQFLVQLYSIIKPQAYHLKIACCLYKRLRQQLVLIEHAWSFEDHQNTKATLALFVSWYQYAVVFYITEVHEKLTHYSTI